MVTLLAIIALVPYRLIGCYKDGDIICYNSPCSVPSDWLLLPWLSPHKSSTIAWGQWIYRITKAACSFVWREQIARGQSVLTGPIVANLFMSFPYYHPPAVPYYRSLTWAEGEGYADENAPAWREQRSPPATHFTACRVVFCCPQSTVFLHTTQCYPNRSSRTQRENTLNIIQPDREKTHNSLVYRIRSSTIHPFSAWTHKEHNGKPMA